MDGRNEDDNQDALELARLQLRFAELEAAKAAPAPDRGPRPKRHWAAYILGGLFFFPIAIYFLVVDGRAIKEWEQGTGSLGKQGSAEKQYGWSHVFLIFAGVFLFVGILKSGDDSKPRSANANQRQSVLHKTINGGNGGKNGTNANAQAAIAQASAKAAEELGNTWITSGRDLIGAVTPQQAGMVLNNEDEIECYETSDTPPSVICSLEPLGFLMFISGPRGRVRNVQMLFKGDAACGGLRTAARKHGKLSRFGHEGEACTLTIGRPLK